MTKRLRSGEKLPSTSFSTPGDDGLENLIEPSKKNSLSVVKRWVSGFA